ncbi:methylenetetrahydrofolate reductase [NAD(P)H] [Lacticaseibacillus camelliae]|uniref:Methylenetetrahydrofolate reductase n=1 Tax=Lacticaseibacillus camelliae DSM 22697 = JCM 13995 TaxID=1423730 RepID=A0A0R2F3E7_9LACO|nr:methylenetetrahydrofolate reductase [NAD(P)H] [Lacticaseibacillus camelliae]KRN22278.1 5,10-methylenetetrahydrofolate reductase [Lacticaseibacillus camelliae DSM 22697 = JCM 13995]
MKVNRLFKDHQVLSFELFPPRRRSPEEDYRRIDDTISAVSELNPDFVSVTLHTGKKDQRHVTLDLADRIQKKYGLPAVAHLPAVQLTTAEVDSLLEDFKAAGIENILALRGDIPNGGRVANDFPHASDLITHIHEYGDFNVVAACYPETHPEATSPEADLQHLKEKVDAGASQLISQLFFDNHVFYDFVDRARAAGITVPIEAGIMPVLSQHQIDTMALTCGVSLPEKFLSMMKHYEGRPDALRDAGIAYAIDQIVDLMVHGVDGIHLYTMDNPTVAKRIVEATRSLVRQ